MVMNLDDFESFRQSESVKNSEGGSVMWNRIGGLNEGQLIITEDEP